MSENTRKKGTDDPKATGVYVTIAVFERFWVVSPFFTPVLFFIIYPARQLQNIFTRVKMDVSFELDYRINRIKSSYTL